MAYVTVDIDISEIDWDELVYHIEDNHHFVIDRKTLQDISEARNYGSQERVYKLIDNLIYKTFGKIV